MMGELLDSTHLAGNHEALRAQVRADGYVFLRGAVDVGAIAAARAGVMAGLAAAGWVAPGPDPDRPAIVPPPRATSQAHAWADTGFRAAAGSPAFNALPYGPRLSAVMGMIMGAGAFPYPVKVLRVVYPAALVPDHGGAHVHRDYGVLGVQDMFTTWVPLMDIPRTLGGLAVKPGSQTERPSPPVLLGDDTPGWLTANYRPGDVLVFHCLTAHAALPNRTGHLRLSGDFRWQLATDAVPRGMVYGPGGIELFSRVFAREPWWRPVPAGLTFRPGPDRPLPGSPLPPSRYVDAPPVWGGAHYQFSPH